MRARVANLKKQIGDRSVRHLNLPIGTDGAGANEDSTDACRGANLSQQSLRETLIVIDRGPYTLCEEIFEAFLVGAAHQSAKAR